MPKFISDDEMKQLDGAHASRPGFISDEDLAKMDMPEEKPWYDVSGSGLARGAIDAIPIVGGIGGGILGAPAGPVGSVGAGALGYAGGKELSDILKNRLLGDQATSVDPIEQAKRVGGNLTEGAAMEMGGQATGSVLGSLASKIGSKAGSVAEKLAVKATGATGKQAADFAPNAGRELLDRGLVRFGDSAENIAGRTEGAMDSANAAIDSALKSLDAKGVTASADNVVSELQNHIKNLQRDPSQAGVVKNLQGIVDDIIQTGESNVPVSAAETTKRGFNQGAGNWMDPQAGQANKKAYLAYRDEVERAAQAADPSVASQFKEGKDTYGLLSPIQEAAQKRGLQQNQSPLGGLGDWAAGGAGSVAGGGPGAAMGVAAKRFVAPRAASAGAVSADKISQALLKSPQMTALFQKNPQAFNSLVGQMEKRIGGGAESTPMHQQFQKTAGDDGEYVAKNFDSTSGKDAILAKTQGSKFQQAMQSAAQRGDKAVAANHFILQQTNPEYRQLMEEDENDNQGQN